MGSYHRNSLPQQHSDRRTTNLQNVRVLHQFYIPLLLIFLWIVEFKNFFNLSYIYVCVCRLTGLFQIGQQWTLIRHTTCLLKKLGGSRKIENPSPSSVAYRKLLAEALNLGLQEQPLHPNSLTCRPGIAFAIVHNQKEKCLSKDNPFFFRLLQQPI